jgi:deoxyribonuclease-4
MNIGAHISKNLGYLNSINSSLDIGANCVQLMTGSPQKINFPLKSLTETDFNDFTAIKKVEDFKIYIHSPYIMNLCNPDRIGLNTKIILEDLTICDYINGFGVVIHTGNKQKEQTLDNAYKTYIKTVKNILRLYKGKSKILLETSAGQGNSIGVSIQDFAEIYNSFNISEQKNLGLVVDTCHIFVSGYDISTKNGMINYLMEFDERIGLEHIDLIHLNDSKINLGGKIDRHDNIGKGFIFNKSFESIEILKGLDIPMILETRDIPPYRSYEGEIKLVKSLKTDNTELKLKKEEIKDRKLMIKYFDELAKIYNKLGDKFRADSYYEVIYRLKNMYKLPQTKEELMKIEGIGDGIADKILEIIKTKKLKYLEKLQNDSKVISVLSLLEISGIGHKKALELFEQDIMSYNDLKKAITVGDIKLTKSQQVGYLYYNDLKKKIPRREADRLHKYLEKKKNKLKLVGSYRRGNKTLNDIDILAVDITMEDVIKYLSKKYKIIDYISKGEHKSSFLMIIDKVVRHIDILITTKDSYYLALLYFTGSKYFNIEMRTIAKERGYKINEYNLTKGSTKIKITSDADIFNELDINYIEPENR